MKRQWHWAGLVVAALLGAALAGRLLLPRDPPFEGKPLSRHLEVFTEHGLHFGGVHGQPTEPEALQMPRLELGNTSEDAYRAIRAVGTNALPMLALMLESRDAPWARPAFEFSQRHPWLRRFFPIPPPASWARQVQALAAVRELGPRAAPILPRVIRLLDDPEQALVGVVAFLALKPTLEADVLSLTNVLRISQPSSAGATPAYLHSAALLALGAFGPRAAGAGPVLFDCLQATNARVRAAAATALFRIGAPAREVVPVVTSNLAALYPAELEPPQAPRRDRTRRGPSPGILVRAMEADRDLLMNLWALSQYGPDAREALPVLEALESRLQGGPRDAVTGTIRSFRGAPVPP